MNRHIQQMAPYISGYQPKGKDNFIKLNSNENPYPPTPQILTKLNEFNPSLLRLYPDSKSETLRKSISDNYQIESDMIFCGNGSDEIISLIFKVFLEEGDSIVIPYPTYTVYKTAADIHKVQCNYIQTNNQLEIEVEALLEPDSNAIFIANPNAPTGLLLPLQAIEHILQNYKGLLVIDEAYIDFADGQSTALQLLEHYSNLLVIRTFSKSYSLCGARVGYCFGDIHLIESLNKCKDSYNLNVISQLLASTAIEDQEYFKNNIDKIIRSRNNLTCELEKIGFTITPSSTNFLLCQPSSGTSLEIYKFLEAHNIFVRHFNSPRIDDKLRITIGNEYEISELLKQLQHFADK